MARTMGRSAGDVLPNPDGARSGMHATAAAMTRRRDGDAGATGWRLAQQPGCRLGPGGARRPDHRAS